MIISSESKITKKKLLEQIAFNTSVSTPIDSDVTSDIHGNRIEKRTVFVYDDVYEITAWPGVRSVIVVHREIRIKGTNKFSTEKAYFISSLHKDASFFQRAIRGHWAIENSLHYVKDVTFGEDNSTIRTKNAPVNFSIVRTIAMTLFRRNGYSNIKQAIRSVAFDVKKLYGMLA